MMEGNYNKRLAKERVEAESRNVDDGDEWGRIEQQDRGVAEFVIKIEHGECRMIIHKGTSAEETVAVARGRHYTPLFDFCKVHLQLLGVNRKLALLDEKGCTMLKHFVKGGKCQHCGNTFKVGKSDDKPTMKKR
jgi:hypothetical protein